MLKESYNLKVKVRFSEVYKASGLYRIYFTYVNNYISGSVLNLFLRVNIITQNSLKAVLGVGSVPHHEKRSEVG